MMASVRLFVVASFVVGCTTMPRPQVERRLERDLTSHFGITASVSCPSVTTVPGAGDTVICETTHEGESYRVRMKVDERRHGIVSVFNSDAVLLPLSLLESRSGEKLQCPNERHLRVTVQKPGYCKIIGADDHLRIYVTDMKTEQWFHERTSPGSLVQKKLARFDLEVTVTCSKVAPVDGARGTCDVKTTAGEQFQVRFKLGDEWLYFVRGDSPVVILPATATLHANSAVVSLQCPRRVAKPDEPVRCSFPGDDGKQIGVNVAVDFEGNARLF